MAILVAALKRLRAIDELRRLVDKYPEGFEEWEADLPKTPKLGLLER